MNRRRTKPAGKDPEAAAPDPLLNPEPENAAEPEAAENESAAEPKAAEPEAAAVTKAAPKTVVLAQNIRAPGCLFLAGEQYPIGDEEGQVHPDWLRAQPRLDRNHPENVAATQARDALQAKIRERNFRDGKEAQGKILARVGYGPDRRRTGLGL